MITEKLNDDKKLFKINSILNIKEFNGGIKRRHHFLEWRLMRRRYQINFLRLKMPIYKR